MRFLQTRDVFQPDWTLSVLCVEYTDGWVYGRGGWYEAPATGPLELGFVCEDEDRGLLRSWGSARCRNAKVKGDTAIPVTDTTDYRVILAYSPRYADRKGADGMPLCLDGRMMLLDRVPAFQGVRCHPGTDEDDTDACLLPGLHRDVAKGIVTSSTAAYRWMDARVRDCERRGEPVWWRIVRDPAAWKNAPLNPERAPG